MTLLERLGRRPKPLIVAAASVLVLLQSLINYLAGPDFSVLLFYLLPVSLVAWLVGRRAAALIALACAVAHFATEYSSHHFDGREHITLFNAAAGLGAFLFVAYFISTLRRSHEHERELARTDDLTGATNRRSFYEAAKAEISRARRHRHPFTVAYLDVDNFKELNDAAGHAAGDAVLRSVARTIARSVREIDLLGRLGGDEFAILLPETGEEAARAVVARVRDALAATAGEHRRPVTFSVGVVTWMSAPRTVDVMMRQADEMMYEVKNSGKNRVAHRVVAGEPASAPQRDRAA